MNTATATAPQPVSDLQRLAQVVSAHGFRARIQNGTLYGYMIYTVHTRTGIIAKEELEHIGHTLHDVRLWLGY